MSDGWCEECGKKPSLTYGDGSYTYRCEDHSTYKEGFAAGLREAVVEVQGWRDLTIKAHRECKYTNPKEAEREHKNKLNLLGVIESKLRTKAGDDPKAVYREAVARKDTAHEG